MVGCSGGEAGPTTPESAAQATATTQGNNLLTTTSPSTEVQSQERTFDIVPTTVFGDEEFALVDSSDGQCILSMSHVITGNQVTAVMGGDMGTPCDVGVTIWRDQMTADYPDKLEIARQRWEAFLTGVALEVIDGQNEVIEDYHGDRQLAASVGRAFVDPAANTVELSLFGGYIGDGRRLEDSSELPYGPSDCWISGEGQGRTIRDLGSVTYYGAKLTLGMLVDEYRSGATCSLGHIILYDKTYKAEEGSGPSNTLQGRAATTPTATTTGSFVI